MALTRIVKELAPELRDVGNMNAGILADARMPYRLMERAEINVSPDLNAATKSGYYGQSDSTLNKSPLNYAIVHVEAFSADWITQTATWTFATGTDVLRWRRHRHSGTTWGPWYQLADHKAGWLGTVSQSGGVPTGAIIERGSNSNGEYVKFADGTMICRHVIVQAITANTDTTVTWTFPASYLGPVPASVFGSYAPFSTQAYNVTKFSVSEAYVSTAAWFRTDHSQSFNFHFAAIGRWI